LATEMFVLRVYGDGVMQLSCTLHYTMMIDDVVKARKSVVKLPTPRLT